MVKDYMKKQVMVQAIVWTGININEISEFITGQEFYETTTDELIIKTLEGDMRADIGDYVIKGVKGEFYPCKPDIFEMSYEEVEKSEEIKSN